MAAIGLCGDAMKGLTFLDDRQNPIVSKLRIGRR